ncbi:DNA cytosine methyltransferase [Leuconostoc mesenteroides]|uniref:DNA cytosine methyltransferase n=1 Tax=Leuconostoc mesenteroides TaxID=1245 RepID=UPI00235E2352|nr:DNA cytosine methyltransferase [Leuconostoc mesenteroides]
MKFLDLFSGIGGFRLGLERSGHTPVGYVEIDKYARKSYQAMYNTDSEWTAEDIFKVTDEEWRKFNGTVELIAGGFPCQSFSIAGKREGFLNRTKGTLFFEVARAVKQIKPRFVFLENVKGLLNHDKGNTFRTILNTFDELGYDVEWRICNSKNFGVPQNRERVYIIGHLRADSGREVFPFFREDGEANPTNVKQVGNISESNSFGGNPQTGRVYSNDGLSPTLNTMQGGGREPKVMVAKPHFGRLGKQAVKTANNNNFDTVLGSTQKNAAKTDGTYSPTLTSAMGMGGGQTPLLVKSKVPYSIRKLTPRETWRLQAFPDELFDKAQQAGLSDSQLYKQAGNSVTVNVIEYIGNLLKERE